MKLSWEKLSLRPDVPFRTSRAVQKLAERVWARIELDGLEGWGEADPSPYYGESAETVAEALDRMRPVLASAPDPDHLEAIESRLCETVPGNGSAHAAVSAALHDLFGKRAGMPVWQLLGLDPADAPLSSFTIGIDEPAAMAERVRTMSGWPILKIKLGTDHDREIVEAIREADESRRLQVDANAAWTPDEAIRNIRDARGARGRNGRTAASPRRRDGLETGSRQLADSDLCRRIVHSLVRRTGTEGTRGRRQHQAGKVRRNP